MKNVFSQSEPEVEVDPAFLEQGPPTLPTAPSCNPHLPDPAPVPLRTPELETLAERSGQRVDWKNTRIE